MPLQVNSVTVTVTASSSSFVPAEKPKHAGLRQLVYWIHPAGSFPIDGTGVQISTHAIFFFFSFDSQVGVLVKPDTLTPRAMTLSAGRKTSASANNGENFSIAA